MENYDYIIVGGGSAGCVLANRLSKDPANKVLLLEAGKRSGNLHSKVPAGFHNLFKSAFDWNYETIPQASLKQRKLFQPRGKLLGGSGAINAMIYIRGHQKDFDDWEQMGNPGWSYEEVLPYFKRSEHQAHILNEFHGTEGEWSICHRTYTSPLSMTFIEAAKELGYANNHDFNGQEQEGFGLYQVNHRKGLRCSPADAFIEPVKNRDNLHIITEAQVEKILFTDQNASGIQYSRKGKTEEAYAIQEVILSAGAFNSPHILMLSGIGPGKHLQEHHIPLIHDLPGVGQNLQDHLVTIAAYECNSKETLDKVEDFPNILYHLLYHSFTRKGPLASNVAEAGGFIRSSPKEVAPDIQYHFVPAYWLEHGFQNPKYKRGYSIGSKLLIPKSKGNVRLASNAAKDAPMIDPQYLSHPSDQEKSVQAFRIGQQLGDANIFGSVRNGYFAPSSLLKKDEDILEFIRTNAETLYHPVGTCKMGKDPMAVVDHRLKVHGLGKLRVVDASIMPVITRGNTQAPTIMIAEKAADMILHDS